MFGDFEIEIFCDVEFDYLFVDFCGVVFCECWVFVEVDVVVVDVFV